MKLVGESGEAIDNIACSVLTLPLVGVDDSGENIIRDGRARGIYLPPEEAFPGAPEDCPLTKKSSERELGSFAICITCPLSFVNLPRERELKY